MNMNIFGAITKHTIIHMDPPWHRKQEGMSVEKHILSYQLIEIIGEYHILKSKERILDIKGKPFGRIQTWYDVCLNNENLDIVSSFKTKRDAIKWAKEEL